MNFQRFERKEKEWTQDRYLIEKIIKSHHRVGILYLLAKHKVLTPHELAYRLGVYPRSIIYHLDKLLNWNLIKLNSRDKRGYRESFRLNEEAPKWVELVLKKGIIAHGQRTLAQIVSRNEEKR